MAKAPDIDLDAAVAAEQDPFEAAGNAELERRFAILSPAEIQAARDEAHKRFNTTAKKAAVEAVVADETRRLKLKTGDGFKDEEIYLHVDLAPYTDRLIIDGATYLHGHSYKLPRHMVESMREMVQRTWDHEADIKGESIRQKMGQYRTQNFDQIEGQKVAA